MHEESNTGSANLKLYLETMPDFTEPNNKRVAKISVALTMENVRMEDKSVSL